jgi:hypothetical protein
MGVAYGMCGRDKTCIQNVSKEAWKEKVTEAKMGGYYYYY